MKNEGGVSLEGLIRWGSVAYACGFLVVFLHTARLGLPVLELIEPVYIWIGLPFAILGLFSRRLVSWLKARSREHRDTLLGSFQKVDQAYDEAGERELLHNFVKQVSQHMPWVFPTRLIDKALGRSIEGMIRSAGSDAGRREKLLRALAVQLQAFRAAAAIQGFFNLAAFVFLTAAAIFLYVKDIYPRIPQSYGGGAPLRVKLLLESSKVPTMLRLDRAGVVLSREVDLLYFSSDTYWVRSPMSPEGCVLDQTSDAPSIVLAPGLVVQPNCILGLTKDVVSGMVLVR